MFFFIIYLLYSLHPCRQQPGVGDQQLSSCSCQGLRNWDISGHIIILYNYILRCVLSGLDLLAVRNRIWSQLAISYFYCTALTYLLNSKTFNQWYFCALIGKGHICFFVVTPHWLSGQSWMEWGTQYIYFQIPQILFLDQLSWCVSVCGRPLPCQHISGGRWSPVAEDTSYQTQGKSKIFPEYPTYTYSSYLYWILFFYTFLILLFSIKILNKNVKYKI